MSSLKEYEQFIKGIKMATNQSVEILQREPSNRIPNTEHDHLSQKSNDLNLELLLNKYLLESDMSILRKYIDCIL